MRYYWCVCACKFFIGKKSGGLLWCGESEREQFPSRGSSCTGMNHWHGQFDLNPLCCGWPLANLGPYPFCKQCRPMHSEPHLDCLFQSTGRRKLKEMAKWTSIKSKLINTTPTYPLKVIRSQKEGNSSQETVLFSSWDHLKTKMADVQVKRYYTSSSGEAYRLRGETLVTLLKVTNQDYLE